MKVSENLILQRAAQIGLVLSGNAIYALAVQLFLLPAGLVTGGTTGIALAVRHACGIPVPCFVLVFNVLMLALGAFFLGRVFALTTILSTFAYPAFLELFSRLFCGPALTQDIVLCTLFSGLGIGLALGLVIRAGASTGGMDIPPLLLYRFWGIPVSFSLYLFDFCILLLQAVFQPTEKLLYGLLLVLTYTIVLDKLILMGTSRTEIKVVSRKSEEICRAILGQLDRGVTLLAGEGGYLHQKTPLILSVVSNRELPRVEKLIRSIDPESFLVISRVSEVRGRGFSMSKKYCPAAEDCKSGEAQQEPFSACVSEPFRS